MIRWKVLAAKVIVALLLLFAVAMMVSGVWDMLHEPAVSRVELP